MHILPNSNRSDSFGEEPSETGSVKTASPIKQFFKDLIQKADTVPLTTIFSHYNIKADAVNRKITCPFKKHSNGKERTGSFLYYPDTNTFWCFGCKTGRSSSDFVANMDNISRAKSAYRILELYGTQASNCIENENSESYSEQLEIMMEFSNFVREFTINNRDNLISLNIIEQATMTFDMMNNKHKLDNNSLKELVSKIKEKITK